MNIQLRILPIRPVPKTRSYLPNPKVDPIPEGLSTIPIRQWQAINKKPVAPLPSHSIINTKGSSGTPFRTSQCPSPKRNRTPQNTSSRREIPISSHLISSHLTLSHPDNTIKDGS
ncbi:hypothetical protein MPH_12332 [Macrophomina phaseolina MS6]|uniref:Uncharacterized protein n=1 Tax=Macrophomina phaseolina (strain MS6) TaxID=1126212 RepID=K2RK20_MACPH|nr:hypothetical protein MPH_12332 [Macrophomina phaseolina MS6]